MACTPQIGHYLGLQTKIILALLILILAGCLIGASPSHGKVRIYDFEDKVKQADIIVLGKVIKVQKRLFAGNIAIISAENMLKGKVELDKLIVRFGNAFINTKRHNNRFTSDRTYILFLNTEDSEFKILGGYQGHYEINNDGYVCYGGHKTRLEYFIANIKKVLSGSSPEGELY